MTHQIHGAGERIVAGSMLTPGIGALVVPGSMTGCPVDWGYPLFTLSFHFQHHQGDIIELGPGTGKRGDITDDSVDDPGCRKIPGC